MDARNFLLSSDYPMPVICWQYSGSIANISSYSTKSTTITHNLAFTPLIIGVWSDNSNFEPCYDISNGYGPASQNGDLMLNALGSNTTNVLIEAYNATSSKKTLYFRLWAFVPPDYVGEVPNVYDTTNFMLSTDFNYPKIVKQGVVQISSGSTSTIPHGLGYIPQCKVWGPDDVYTSRTGRGMLRVNQPSALGGSYGPLITSTDLTIKALNTGKHYYMIFGDEI